MENSPFSIFSIGEDQLTKKILAHSVLATGLGKMKTDIFKDSEMSPQFQESVRDKTVFLVCSTTSPIKILQLELAIDAAMRASAGKIVALIPYFGYSRQDKKEGPRGAIGAKVIANKLTAAGVHHIITSDLHADQIQGYFDLPVDHIYGRAIYRQYIESLPAAENYAIFSPDAGGVKRAERIYEKMESIHPLTTLGLCSKKRAKANEVEKMIIIGDVKGKKIKLVDDIVDTAGTLVKGAEIMMEAGAESVEAWITHPVLSGPAKERIEKCDALSKLVVTDSIYHEQLPDKVQVISASQIFAKVIDRMVTHQSIENVNA